MNCPNCGKELSEENGKLVCQSCGYGKAVDTSPQPSVEPVTVTDSGKAPEPVMNPEISNSQSVDLPQPSEPPKEEATVGPMAQDQPTSSPKSDNPFLAGIELPKIEKEPEAKMTGLNLKGKTVSVNTTTQVSPYLNSNNEDEEEKVKIDYKQIIIIAIISILIIVTFVVSLIYYLKLTKATMIGDKPTGQFSEAEITNCDEIGPSKQISDPTGKNQTCIKESFLQCKPAKVNFASYGAAVNSTASKPAPETLVEYEIIGPNNNLCNVKITYLKTPAPLPDVKEFDFNSKNMSCNFEGTQDAVFQEVFGFTNGQYFTTLEKMTSQPEVKCSGGAFDLQQLMKKALNK